ncbi:hypothetical protein BS47DRAFT_1366367 [Hydnum rufescens UP504]|uniref:Uncharacterized protein n=1 Tax=Hydnum rufescens UP504 TaxID=1448309 RepID=A0A9P6DQZ0_9AGAM|nr:hypothetical protein BS47DRAFT_1366367 [Hydnum rufescens UP504]
MEAIPLSIPRDPPSPPQPEATPLLSRLGPVPTLFPQGSVAPTASVSLSVSDVSTPWPPPECLRLAQWYALDIAGVDGQEDPLTWVHQNSHLGVLAARRVKPIQKKGMMYHMYLLFKDVAKQDSCRSVLVSSCGGKTLLPFLYMDTLVNCFGVAEVRYMQEVYINAISTAEIQELLAVGPRPYMTPSDAIPEMLNYIWYPALLDPHPAPPKHEQTRAMISVKFNTEWLSRQLHHARKEDPGSVTVVPGGTMISDIRQISRWAYADLGGSKNRLLAMSGNIVRLHNINSLWWSLVLDSVTIHSLFPAPLKTFHPLHSFYWLLVIFQQTCEVPGLHLPLLPLASLWGFLESLVKTVHTAPYRLLPSAFFWRLVHGPAQPHLSSQLPYTFNPSSRF